MGANVQVCWEKFCRYWDVEPRLVPVSEQAPHLTAAGAVEHCDENTIGVVAILGSTYDGSYEPVAEIAAALDRLQADSGLDVPIHVDAASGGFVAPFLDPDLVWDFRLPRVQSINASGHKYGLVYPGVGWAVWRDKAALPEDLIFEVDYLGGRMPTFALNFSRGGAQVVAQYYSLHPARPRRLPQRPAGLARHRPLSRGRDRRARAVPADLRRLAAAGRSRSRCGPRSRASRVFDVSEALRVRGWIVPAYPMPPAIEDLAVLRICVRNGFSRDLASLLLEDLGHALTRVQGLAGHLPEPDVAKRAAFHH